MKATFIQNKNRGCCCSCCSYRQFVKTTYTVKRGNESETQIIDEEEDIVLQTGQRYGHRDLKESSNDIYLNPPEGKDKRLEGCKYVGFDAPGQYKHQFIIGVEYNVDFDFRGEIIDTCNNKHVVDGQSKKWAINLKHTF